jgi:hypothetical protein
MRRLSCAALVVVAACSPAVHPSHLSLDPLTWKARAAFDSAVQAGDTARMGRLFAPGAFVIAATGDTIPLRDAIAVYLAQSRQDTGAIRFSWGREGSLESCVGGAREQLVYTAHLTRPDGSASAASGHVAVFWKSDSAGAPKVAWIAFAKDERRRRLTRSECPSVEAAVWRSWRWAVSAYATGACTCKVRIPEFTPASKWAVVVPPNLVTVQYHVRRHVVAEIATGGAFRRTTTGTRYYPNRDYGLTRIGSSAEFLAALVSYEQRGFQVGGGPIVQLTHWRLRDSLVPFSTGGPPSFHDTTWSHVPVGIVGDVRYSRLVGTRTFVTFGAQVRRLPDAKTPAATPRLAAALDQSTALFGIGFGVIF